MDIGTVDHLLTTTRSVRKRLDLSRSVEPETIQRCLDIAIQAPAGGNLAPYHFLVVTDPRGASKSRNCTNVHSSKAISHVGADI